MTIFLDTSALIALFVDKEQGHKEVKTQYQQYKTQRALLITSNLVLSELYTRLVYEFGTKVVSHIASKMAKVIEEGQLRVLWVDEDLFNKALSVLIKFGEHKISFTDAASYVLSKEFRADEVFTLDSDFRKMGLTAAPNIRV